MKWQIKIEVKNGKWERVGVYRTRGLARIAKRKLGLRHYHVKVSKFEPEQSIWARIWQWI